LNQIREKFRILDSELLENILLLHIYDNYDDIEPYEKNGINILIVTKPDDVFAYGRNSYGVLGLGHKQPVDNFTKVNILCNKNIIKFTNGFSHLVALTEQKKVMCWSNNYFGQCGSHTVYRRLKPHFNDKLLKENTIDIACGRNHSLALTEDGYVFTWGKKKSGDDSIEFLDLTPRKLDIPDEKVIAIACGAGHSLALTEKGHVYSWGINWCGQLGNSAIDYTETPTFVRLDAVITKIAGGWNHTMLLTNEGIIYEFGMQSKEDPKLDNKFFPVELQHTEKFIDIGAHHSRGISMAISENGDCFIWGKIKDQIIPAPLMTELKNFDDIFISKYEITYSSIKL
jgi:alpha-tubulin suppressor-like RCC1 family protein